MPSSKRIVIPLFSTRGQFRDLRHVSDFILEPDGKALKGRNIAAQGIALAIPHIYLALNLVRWQPVAS